MVTGFKQGNYEKKFVSRIYNGLSRALFDVPVKDLNSVKAYRREIMDTLPVRPDWHRYMIVIAAAACSMNSGRLPASSFAGTSTLTATLGASGTANREP